MIKEKLLLKKKMYYYFRRHFVFDKLIELLNQL